ncbi:MAG: hypothetical protein PHW53_04605 [Patescibacteria group bacterium]|nr:hypothetical protein [Patescibacteria group bacterium]
MTPYQRAIEEQMIILCDTIWKWMINQKDALGFIELFQSGIPVIRNIQTEAESVFARQLSDKELTLFCSMIKDDLKQAIEKVVRDGMARYAHFNIDRPEANHE